MKKAKKLHIGLAIAAVLLGAHSLIVTDADSYTAVEGDHLKDSIVETVVATNTETTESKTLNLMAVVIAETSDESINNEELKLQEEYLKAKAEEEAQAAEYARIESSRIHVNKMNKVLSGKLSGYGQYIYDRCQEYGVDPYLAVAISMYETGWGNSNLAITQNNFGGMRYAGVWLSYSSIEEGLDAYIRNLSRNYVAWGLTTPESMVNKYAEGSSTWVSSVNAIYYQVLYA